MARSSTPRMGLPLGWTVSMTGRLATWTLIALVAATVLLAGYFASGIGSARVDLLVFWLTILLCDLSLSVVSLAVARGSPHPPARRIWTAIGTAGTLIYAGDLGRAIAAFVDSASVIRTLTIIHGASLFLGVCLVLIMALRYPTDRSTRGENASFWLDTASVILAAAAFSWYVAVPPDANRDELVDALLLTMALLVAAFAGARMLFSRRPPANWPAGMALVLALAAEAVLDPLLPLPDLSSIGDYGVLAAVRLLPSLLAALGPLTQVYLIAVGRAPRPLHLGRTSFLPYIFMVAVFAGLVAALPPLDARVTGLLVAALVIVALVLTRQLIAFTDNARLVDELDHALDRMRRQERQTSALLERSYDITSLFDHKARFKYVSPALEKLFGYSREEMIGRSVIDFMHPDEREEYRAKATELVMRPGSTMSLQARFRHADGSWRWLDIIATNFLNEPDIAGIVSNAREYTEARELQERLRHQASHDPLTQLANRSLFTERLGQAVAAAGPGAPVAVMVLDLDDFKHINDTLGHHAGDQALKVIADLLRACVRDTDLPARLGGDEFAVLLPNTSAAVGSLVAQRLLTALEQPVIIDRAPTILRVSIGLASTTGEDADELLRTGDTAMYLAKQQGKNRYVIHPADGPNRQAVRTEQR